MLNIINKSPMTNVTLDSCLNTAAGGDILLIEDAVYAATKGNALKARCARRWAGSRSTCLLPDLEARGLADRIIDGVITSRLWRLCRPDQ